MPHKKGKIWGRVIIHNNEEGYCTINMRESRNGTLEYFNKVNKGLIHPRDINEKKLFNYTDYYYILQCNIFAKQSEKDII